MTDEHVTDHDTVGVSERQATEVALLEAMYPDQTVWNEKASELKFTTSRADTDNGGATLVLRLPEHYPGTDLPLLISASDGKKGDLRDRFRRIVDDLDLQRGEEVLDTIVQTFDSLPSRMVVDGSADLSLDSRDMSHDEVGTSSQTDQGTKVKTAKKKAEVEGDHLKTVVVWLHHLLATSKRKLALHPSMSTSFRRDTGSAVPRWERQAMSVSGITKPGYPGVMVFSGPASLVDAHVAELKNQRWQAFQVRFEERYEYQTHSDNKAQGRALWQFEHGVGIVEVEDMSQVVHDIVGNDNKQAFLTCIGVK